MSGGVKAIRSLLANNASLTAVVPAARIMAGPLPQGTDSPALAITHVSAMPRLMVAAGSSQFFTARVQVTVLAPSYAVQRQVLKLVRDAVPRKPGTVNNVQVDAILPDVEGPDFTSDAGLYMGSHDFVVTYTE